MCLSPLDHGPKPKTLWVYQQFENDISYCSVLYRAVQELETVLITIITYKCSDLSGFYSSALIFTCFL